MKAYEGVKVFQVHAPRNYGSDQSDSPRQNLTPKKGASDTQEASLDQEPLNAAEKGQIFCPCQGLNPDPTFQPVVQLRYQVSCRNSYNWCSNFNKPDSCTC